MSLLRKAEKFRSNRERRSWQVTHGIADKNTPRIVNTLLLEVRDTQKKINVAAVSRAVAAGNVKAIEEALLLPNLDAGLRAKYQKQLTEVLGQAGVANVKLQPKVLASSFGRFDLTNPRAVEWARAKSSDLVREITEGTKRTIRSVVADGIENGVPVRTTARRLRSSIGLTERQWTSVSNFREKEIRAGVSLPNAERRADKFAQKVHRRRAELIARTETIDASVQGRFELWDQAGDRGLIDQNETKRKWIVTPDDRLDSLICLPMSGQLRGMQEPFLTGDGRLIMRPTAHPGCRCDVILVIPGTSIFEDAAPRSASRERSIVTPQVSTPGAGATTIASTTVTPRSPALTALGRRLRRRPPGEELVVPRVTPGTQFPAGRRAVQTRPGEAPLTLPTGPPVAPPRPINPTPEEVFTRHPQLEPLRGRINIENFSDPRVREVVDDFAKISPNVLKKMAEAEANFGVSATKSVPDMMGLPAMNRRRPRGWQSGTWRNVGGGYFQEKNTAYVAVGRRGVSQSVALHEYGHAIGRNLKDVTKPKGTTIGRLDAAPEVTSANGRAFDKLPKYFRQGGRGGRVGSSEMFAESTAFYYKPPPGMTGKEAVARFVDKDFATWLDKQLR